MLSRDMPCHGEPEGRVVPAELPPVIDTHVHVFPDTIFSAVRSWFDAHAWHIRYQMKTREVFEFLLSRGLAHIVACQYAHKPGMAPELNAYMARQCQAFKGRVTGLATVFPGEKGSRDILQKAFDAGLKGVKLHIHVQCFDMNSPAMAPVYAVCRDNGMPLLIHAGREPKSEAYACDPYQLCRADKVAQVLDQYPDLKICVPHLGFDETRAYEALVRQYDTLWLDTTMALSDYFPAGDTPGLEQYRPDRIMYGSDFPNIPYAWDRELKILSGAGLDPGVLEQICYRNAVDFYGVDKTAIETAAFGGRPARTQSPG